MRRGLLFASLAIPTAAIGAWLCRRDRARFGEVAGRRESLAAMPRHWWRRRAPRRRRVCYAKKTDALNVFREHNQAVIDDYGGESYRQSPAEFDAINTKYGTRVRTIAEALWAAMPPDPPFCLDTIDLEALNDTSPGREHPTGFRVPDYVDEAAWLRREAKHYELEPAPF